MSDIVIKGMEMPKSCFKGVHDHCPFYGDCTALRRFCDNHSNLEIINTIFISRMEDCPLVELPPHGRLKDYDAIIKAWNIRSEKLKTSTELAICLAHCMKEAPTVVEASKE